MPEYLNPNNHAVHLLGPNGKVVVIKSRQKMTLPEYFDKYCSAGFIKKIAGGINYKMLKEGRDEPKTPSRPNSKGRPQRLYKAVNQERSKSEEIARNIKRSIAISRASTKQVNQDAEHKTKTQIKSKHIGRVTKEDASALLRSNIRLNGYPISNGIGVGILSYNRKECLERLINSILSNTDLYKTTIFVSDDCSDDVPTIAYLDTLAKISNIVLLRNNKRLGVAGNTNRLLRCLSRFKYCILLNDDVEILRQGWEHNLIDGMIQTGMHHIMHRQLGVYGAGVGDRLVLNGVELNKVTSKPHGAVLAFTHIYLERCGYFDESYGIYGMEHVDWSMRGYELGLQPEGFYDLESSSDYIKLHADNSSVDNKSDLLRSARSHFNNRRGAYMPPTSSSEVPSIAYVIPFRDMGRSSSILTVVNNVRAQRYPSIEIILVEQDDHTKINLEWYEPTKYHLATTSKSHLFNKSMAFNIGANSTANKHIVLHDADMLVQGNYTATISNILETHGGCHIGNKVLYADAASTARINESGIVDADVTCDRVVGYFEGGSLACTADAYWHCGGFNEDFWGYGVEDCDFYARLSHDSVWYENRTFDFLHLHHGRTDGWNQHHEDNKKLGAILRAKSMQERIDLQYNQLLKRGYDKNGKK